jgi:uncharacterized protein (TIGR02452 family)
MDRNKRIEVATETTEILKQGSYIAKDPFTQKDAVVDLSDVLDAACQGTILHLPDEELRIPDVTTPYETKIYMTNETTLQCLSRLTQEQQDDNIAVLNFASAKSPGGGLRRGSWEQEENLAAASGIVPCLSTDQAKTFYQVHEQLSKPGKTKGTSSPGVLLYTSNMIYSPHVPVFRNSYMELIAPPYTCSVISSCCVNYNTGMFNKKLSKEDEERALRLMQVRVLRVFQVAAHHGIDTLVLGPWGCGINKNSSKEVAKAFSAALLHPDMEGRFKKVVFAVPEKPVSPIYKNFANNFTDQSKA